MVARTTSAMTTSMAAMAKSTSTRVNPRARPWVGGRVMGPSVGEPQVGGGAADGLVAGGGRAGLVGPVHVEPHGPGGVAGGGGRDVALVHGAGAAGVPLAGVAGVARQDPALHVVAGVHHVLRRGGV